MSEWIKVDSSKKPEEYRTIYVYSDYSGVADGYYSDGHFGFLDDDFFAAEHKITHWHEKRRAPKPPTC